jgi:hypothetical protein
VQLRLVGFSNSAGTAAARAALERNPYSRIGLAGWWRVAAPAGQKIPQTLEYPLHGQNVTPPMYNKLSGVIGQTRRERCRGVMRFLEYLVEVFIQTFGITRPSDAQRRRVTLLLGGVLLSAALLAIAVGVGMVFYLRINH